MKKLSVIMCVVLIVAMAGGLFWQYQSLQSLRADNAKLEAAAAELDLLKDEAEQLRKGQSGAAEIEKARQAQSELLRLRGEVSQLREQLKKERDARSAAEKKASAPAVAEETASPVETYTATLRVTLAPQQTLVTGGWKLPNGNRAIVMVEPSLIGNPGEPTQVAVQARFAEMPEEALEKIGLASLKSQGKESTAQSVLEPDQSQSLRDQLEATQGVNLLSAPKITTLDGRQAQIKTVNVRTIGDNQYEFGPVVDIVPKVSADGRSIDMTVIAHLKLESAKAR